METPEQIGQRFAEAGWCIDNGFPGYLVIGYSGDTLSILVRRQELFERDEDDSHFEILDHARDVTYWVREVPTPRQAARLLREHGRPPQDWDEEP